MQPVERPRPSAEVAMVQVVATAAIVIIISSEWVARVGVETEVRAVWRTISVVAKTEGMTSAATMTEMGVG